jgi:hypothetical protein
MIIKKFIGVGRYMRRRVFQYNKYSILSYIHISVTFECIFFYYYYYYGDQRIILG